LSTIEHGMTESSNWVHDSAAQLNPAVPKSDKIETDLNELENFNKTFN